MRLDQQKISKRKLLKQRLYDTFEAFINFYKLDFYHRSLIYLIIPVLTGVFIYILDLYIDIAADVSIYDFMNDYINISLTVTSLFMTLSIGYLSLLIGGNNKGLERVKLTYSKKYKLKGKPILLYSVIYIEIYVLIFTELIMIIYLFLSKFIILVTPIHITKIVLYISIVLFTNLILMMVKNVNNVYFILFD